MRKLLSILLSLVFLLPLLTPLLAVASGSEASLPACCRRNGAHHCAGMMAMQARAEGEGRNVHAPFQPCSSFPHFVGAFHFDHSATLANPSVLFAGLIREPSIAARAECRRRISFDRSRQKRGPPAPLLV